MPAITPTMTQCAGNSYLHAWETLTEANNVGEAISLPGASDRSYRIAGSFGSATVVLQGSYDGTNYFTLHDAVDGASISVTAAANGVIAENVLWIRPSSSGGTDQDVDVSVFSTVTH